MKSPNYQVAELLASAVAVAVSVSMFTSSDTNTVMQVMRPILPEWSVFNLVCALFCLLVCKLNCGGKLERTARFVSGCMWGTIVLLFGACQQFLPVFWVAVAMFGFDFYLVMFRGRAWSRKNSFPPG